MAVLDYSTSGYKSFWDFFGGLPSHSGKNEYGEWNWDVMRHLSFELQTSTTIHLKDLFKTFLILHLHDLILEKKLICFIVHEF